LNVINKGVDVLHLFGSRLFGLPVKAVYRDVRDTAVFDCKTSLLLTRKAMFRREYGTNLDPVFKKCLKDRCSVWKKRGVVDNESKPFAIQCLRK
jgi:hypothetical protein